MCMMCLHQEWLVFSWSLSLDPDTIPTGRFLFDKLSGNTEATISHSETSSEYFEEERLVI